MPEDDDEVNDDKMEVDGGTSFREGCGGIWAAVQAFRDPSDYRMVKRVMLIGWDVVVR